MKPVCSYLFGSNLRPAYADAGINLTVDGQNPSTVKWGVQFDRRMTITGFQLKANSNFAVHIKYAYIKNMNAQWNMPFLLKHGEHAIGNCLGAMDLPDSIQIIHGAFNNPRFGDQQKNPQYQSGTSYVFQITPDGKDTAWHDLWILNYPDKIWIFEDSRTLYRQIEKSNQDPNLVYDHTYFGNLAGSSLGTLKVNRFDIIADIGAFDEFTGISDLYRCLVPYGGAPQEGTMNWLHIRGKDGVQKNIGTLDNCYQFVSPSLHRINFWCERQDVWSYFPCTGNASDMAGKVSWNYEKAEYKEGTPGADGGRFYKGYFHFDSTDGKLAYIANTKTVNFGQNFSADWWFRFPDQKKTVDVAGFRTVNFRVQYESGNYYAFFWSNSENYSKKYEGKLQVVPGIWNHAGFVYIGGTRFAAFVNGQWVISQKDDMIPQDDDWCWWGGWSDPRPSITTNDERKVSVDLCNMRIMKTSTPPWSGLINTTFLQPQLPFEYAICGWNEYLREHRFLPLMQDILNAPIYARIDGGNYGLDPCIQPESYRTDCKVMHLTNDGKSNRLIDLTGKTSWNNGGSMFYPANGHGENRIFFWLWSLQNMTPQKNIGWLQSSNASAICVGPGDFTILVDFAIFDDNHDVADTHPEAYWRNRHSILYAGYRKNGYILTIDPNRKGMYFGIGYEDTSNVQKDLGWAHVDFPFQLGLRCDYRIIVQREKGVYNVWLSGIHLVVNAIKPGSVQNVRHYIGSYDSNNGVTPLRGIIRNLAIWNKPVFPIQPIDWPIPAKEQYGWMSPENAGYWGNEKHANITLIDKPIQLNTYVRVVAHPEKYCFQIDRSTISKNAWGDDFTPGTYVVIHTTACKSTSETQWFGARLDAYITKVDGDKIWVGYDNFHEKTDQYIVQMFTVPCFKNIRISTQLKAKPYDDATGTGGIIMMKANGTADIRDGGLITEGCGLPLMSNLSTSLTTDVRRPAGVKRWDGAEITNETIWCFRPMSQGNGVAEIGARNLIMNENTRFGATWSGALGPGVSMKLGLGHDGGDADGHLGGAGGTPRDINYQNMLSTQYVTVKTQQGCGGRTCGGEPGRFVATKGGATVFIMAEKIDGFSLSAISTGGEGGDNWSTTSHGSSSNGGAGYGGGGGCGDATGWGSVAGGGAGFCCIATRHHLPDNEFAYHQMYLNPENIHFRDGAC